MSEGSYPSALFPSLEENKKVWFPVLWVLNLLSLIYGQLVYLNNWLYKKNFRKSSTLSIPVLSVGNLTVGGTGKTPIIIYLVNLLQAQKLRVGVVSRNYKSSSKEITKVDSGSFIKSVDDEASVGSSLVRNESSVNRSFSESMGRIFGDEPALIFQNTQVPVYVGPQKWMTAKEIVRNEKVDVLCIDDGFQHLKLNKNCNILLLDVTQMDKNNYLFPRGRYRQPLTGCQSANIIFWTKINFVSDSILTTLKQQVDFKGFQVDWKFELASIDFPLYSALNFDLSSYSQQRQEFLSLKRFVLVSAIARPEFFKKMIQELNSKYEIVEKIFSDHHQYNTEDIKKIMDRPLNFKHFITTEKDYTKLKDIWPKDIPLGIAKWKLTANKSDQEIYESIYSFLH